MRVADPGHHCLVEMKADPVNHSSLTGHQIHSLQFIKRVDGVLVTPGLTNEQVLEVLIDRLRWLDEKLPCKENALALQSLQAALHWLNARTVNRRAQGVEMTDQPHAS